MQRTLSFSSTVPPLVLICAVCFNAFLAIVNGHVVALARVHVVLAEISIYAAAIAIILTHADRKMLPWFLLTLFIVTLGLVIALGNGEFNPKYIRDVLVIPVFIMLGMTYHAHRFTTPFLILHGIIFVVAVLELTNPDAYSEIFRILDYYVNTRDFSANSFWNTESKLFVSATRPGDRFFGFVDWHRASSIFLEPVSLGNYCVIAAILTVACWAEFTPIARAYLIGSTLFLLVGCDGRLAAASIGIVLIAIIVVRNISTKWSIFYLPTILAAAMGLVWGFVSGERLDNFTGRVAGTIEALSRLDVPDLWGMNIAATSLAADNGIVYFVLSQSVVGLCAIWLAITLLAPNRTLPSRLYAHGIAIFIPLNLLISYSFFSIKVAGLMWFFYGMNYRKEAANDVHPDYAPGRLEDSLALKRHPSTPFSERFNSSVSR